MPFDAAGFTRDVREVVAENDRMPAQRVEDQLPAVVWVDPRRMGGQPCVYGTRLTTSQVAHMVAEYGIECVHEGWPYLTDEQIEGACWFERTYGSKRKKSTASERMDAWR
jgi:uncharacterized protein (DUF433 family)